ncbi:Arsenical resistance operon repressor [Klebsiella pneumoniae]|uniref:Arsenical resistance operon repressor n=1 Tax=Klebsiella pneumoniae TaxID=573 RepID=A0A378A8E0_KLEPN|nr:Arsenical resistance operon repressor [Klebsiella pneumoniae]
MSLLPLQLFKNLADETRLGIVLLLKARGELVRVRSLYGARPVPAQDLPPSGRCSVRADLLLDRKQGKWVHLPPLSADAGLGGAGD